MPNTWILDVQSLVALETATDPVLSGVTPGIEHCGFVVAVAMVMTELY